MDNSETNTEVVDNSTTITKKKKISIGDSIDVLIKDDWKIGTIVDFLDISELRIQVSLDDFDGGTYKKVVGLTEIKI